MKAGKREAMRHDKAATAQGHQVTSRARPIPSILNLGRRRFIRLASALLCASLAGVWTISAAEAPKLIFEKNIGDMRGKGVNNISVAVGDDGMTYLLMSSGRLSLFDKTGKYSKSLKMMEMPWPQDYLYISLVGGKALLGDYKKDYAFAFLPQRTGSDAGKFNQPSMAIEDQNDKIYVCDTGNNRIQVFASNNQENPERILALKDSPLRIAVRDNLLAVLTKANEIQLYEIAEKDFALKASGKVPAGGRSICFDLENNILLASSWLKKYKASDDGKITEASTIAPSYTDQWPNLFPTRVSMTSGPDKQIWFATDLFGKICSLDPATDTVQERVKGIYKPLAVCFGEDGEIFAGGFPATKEGPDIIAISKDGTQRKFLTSGQPIYKYPPTAVPVFGLLQDKDKGIIVRIVEEGDKKGWPAFTLKRLYPDGTTKPFLDLGSIYNVRAKFHPAFAPYSLAFAEDGNILAAIYPYSAVVKLDKDGKIIWEASIKPQGTADKVEFSGPMDLGVDSRHNIWVCDYNKNKVFCLSNEGKVLLEYGEFAGVDDDKGAGFDAPSGIEIANVGGKDYLYVGDSGNQRIVKFRINWE